ncbi:HNH endonuclease signature motif containing protein [Microbacterium sp. Marseille-Q6648]|uniref:HNH endonuclease n=1 Tax=Microbacterium sp. Marseille-Q6648 TaxID=2937991 RepID=UPI00203A69E4|nr:HNH endonuclease signature motif containing protein [Microbacterium sp. Marseille-Q6648]
MTNPLDLLATAVSSARGLWSGGDGLEALSQSALIALNNELAQAQRVLDSARARVASEIARQSSPDLGPEGLAKKQGYRSPVTLIAGTAGTSNGEAARLLQVGEATAPRKSFGGDKPARRPHVAAAIEAGWIGTNPAAAIISMLDRIALRVDPDVLDESERTLVEKARGLSTNQLHRLLTRAEAWLDPGGIVLREDEMRAKSEAHSFEDKQGMLHINAVFDPERGAPVKAVLEAYVRAELSAQRDGDAAGAGASASDGVGTDASSGSGSGSGLGSGSPGLPGAPRRSIPQMQADALVKMAEHLLGCEHRDMPVEGATVVVRIDLTDLQSGEGSATIDGLAAPVSVATARRMAASGGVIPCVLGADSEILDWGRRRRLFSPAQRLALVERDGGCAMCGAPPSHTKAHHIRWWARDAGPTDLANGVLLCESCHHRVHDNGWEIRIDGLGTRGRVWFLPPPDVDPARTPRLGGRARYDLVS